MSNPAVYLLADTKIRGSVIRIEDNLGEAIHIHIGDIRLSITISDFEAIYDCTKEVAQYLFELKGLDWKYIDEGSLDWDWISRYQNIEKLEISHKKLKDLYTIKRINNDINKQMIVPISKSIFVEKLKNKKISINNYAECNMYGVDPDERLEFIKEKICKTGYPYDNKYILINSLGQIYDGDHRAAVLYYMYGGEYEIPVLEMKYKDETDTIKERIKRTNKRIIKADFIKCAKRIIKIPWRLIKALVKLLKSNSKSETTKNSLLQGCDNIEEVLDRIKKLGVHYYYIPVETKNDGMLINGTIIVDKEGFDEYFSTSTESNSLYEKFAFLYSINRPVIITCKDKIYTIWDRMCCKSFFENSILPLDKYCNKEAWNRIRQNACGYVEASSETQLIYLLCNCIFEKGRFEEKDQKLLCENGSVVESENFKKLVERIFFDFSDRLICKLKNGEFATIIFDYRTYKDY